MEDPKRSETEVATYSGRAREVSLSLVDDSTATLPQSDRSVDESKASTGGAQLTDIKTPANSSFKRNTDGQQTPSSDSLRILTSLRTLRDSIVGTSNRGHKPSEVSTSESSIAVRQRDRAHHSFVLGILMAAGTSAVLSLVNVIIKRLESVSSLEVLTFMAFGVFIGILPAATEEVQPFGPSSAQPLLIVRTVLSLGAAALRLSSLSYLTIADSSIITSLTPLMVAITASLFLAEPCHWTQGAAVALSILGITLVVKPPFLATAGGSFTEEQYIGIAYGLSHTVLNGVTTVCIRATKGVSRSVVVFHYGCLSMLLVSFVSIAMGRLRIFYDGSQIGYLLLISHLTFAVQMFLTKALQIENASVVTIVKTSSDVIFGFVMQAVFLTVYPDMFSMFGGTFVLTGVLIIGLRKIAQAAAPETVLRRRLRFLL